MCFAPESTLDGGVESEVALAFGREGLSRVPLAEAVLWVWRWIAEEAFLQEVFEQERGRPLVDYRTVVESIASTTTKTGLIVKVRLDKKQYKKGKQVPAAEIQKLNIRRHPFHGEWNYTISPQTV